MKNFIKAIDHIQLSMYPDGQKSIRYFYITILGMEEIPNPGSAGGIWLKSESVYLHFGIDPNFIPSEKAHIALSINDLPSLIEVCHKFSIPIDERGSSNSKRLYIKDPVGNKIELISIHNSSS